MYDKATPVTNQAQPETETLKLEDTELDSVVGGSRIGTVPGHLVDVELVDQSEY